MRTAPKCLCLTAAILLTGVSANAQSVNLGWLVGPNTLATPQGVAVTIPGPLTVLGGCTGCGGGGGLTGLSGDVTAGPGAGVQPATIAAGAVTSAKIADGTIVAQDVATNGLALSNLPSIGPNAVLGAAPAGNVAQLAMPSCPDPSHLNWASGGGFSCGSGVPATGAGPQWISLGSGSSNLNSLSVTINYIGAGSLGSLAGGPAPFLVPAAGHVTAMWAGSDGATVSNNQVTWTLVDNGSPIAVSCVVPQLSKQCSVNGLNIAVNAGDALLVSFQVTQGPTVTTGVHYAAATLTIGP